MNNHLALAVSAMFVLPMTAIAKQPTSLPFAETPTHHSCAGDLGGDADGAGQCSAATDPLTTKHTDGTMRGQQTGNSPIDVPGQVSKPDLPAMDSGASEPGDDASKGEDEQGSGNAGIDEGAYDRRHW